ncbi:hypothetical protein [Dongia sp.]|uniref:hypothetical protein n=1 Tax=Dongia sp. TaxID=1977262 RepID=UPI003753590F
MWIRTSMALGALFLVAVSAEAVAGDPVALAQGFKDEEACNQPYAETLDAKAFISCLNKLEKAYKGDKAQKQSYIVGLGFNGWSLANIIAATADNSLFPDIPSRAKASKERKVALQLFDVFRKAQKDQKIKDEDLAELAEAKVEELKPVLDYYDALPKK